jgi:cyanophycinase
VVTSAADNEAAGNEAYSVDIPAGLSYRSLFLLYGMAPKHVTVHRDNYQIHGDISTPQGQANLALLQSADIVFFNGGDQGRHVRSWLNDDATPGALLTALKARAVRN